MSTMQFIAAHNDQAARLAITEAQARSNYRAGVRCAYQAVEARNEGDTTTALWFEGQAEEYFAKSDVQFNAVLQSARWGAL